MDNSFFLHLRTFSYESIIGNEFASFCHQGSSTVTCPHCGQVSVCCVLKTRCCYSSLLFKSILSPQNADTVVFFLALRIAKHSRRNCFHHKVHETKIFASLLRLMGSTLVVYFICVSDKGFILFWSSSVWFSPVCWNCWQQKSVIMETMFVVVTLRTVYTKEQECFTGNCSYVWRGTEAVVFSSRLD